MGLFQLDNLRNLHTLAGFSGNVDPGSKADLKPVDETLQLQPPAFC